MADEREISPDTRLGGALGIASKSQEEPGERVEENPATEDDEGEKGCPFTRLDFDESISELTHRRCGRPIHQFPDGVDESPVCLMHSKDPSKQSGPLFDEFWREFENILERAGNSMEARFDGFVFPAFNFESKVFHPICRFDTATFSQEAIFHGAIFSEITTFQRARFTKETFFRKVTFEKTANFYGAIFDQHTDFSHTTFMEGAVFESATFKQDAKFSGVIFSENARFSEATFLDRAEFRRANFASKAVGQPSAVFAQANFSKPAEIVFDDVDLSRVLFHNCDVSQVWFTSSVRWGTRKDSRGIAVFEETIPRDQELERGLRRDGRRDYRAVAQLYQQLKKNYDSRLDYWTANEFHFGEMEMKRLAAPTNGPLLEFRQLVHRRLSLVALYRYASDYGNSYGKPMTWLLATLVMFAALFPLPGVGLKRQGTRQMESYASVWRAADRIGPNLWAEIRLTGKGALTSVDAATFQRNAEYSPAYPWGRVLAIIETLLTSTLFALFLLAIRRQFRR